MRTNATHGGSRATTTFRVVTDDARKEVGGDARQVRSAPFDVTHEATADPSNADWLVKPSFLRKNISLGRRQEKRRFVFALDSQRRPRMGTPRTRGDHVEAKPPDVSPSHTKRVARAREGLSDESTGPSGAERARGEARLLLALFSVSLLWISSLSVSEYLVDLVLPPGSTRPTDTAAVADAASLLATHARRAERDNAACALRQTTSCVANVRSDCVSEFRRADDVAARNAKVALLATAVAEACVALDTSVEHALRVVANARAPQDFLWTDTDGTDTEETQTCAARDRGLIRARAAVTDPQKTDDSTGLDTRLYEATVTYRAAANTYRSGADAALLDATSLVKARAAYDEEYGTYVFPKSQYCLMPRMECSYASLSTTISATESAD